MTTNFPGSLDSFTNPSATDAMDSVTVPHASQHANLNDAVEALQAKVGVDGSAVTSSLDYKVANHGKWISYTPTLTNFTANSMNCWYCQINKIVFVSVSIDVATMSTGPEISLPVNNLYDASHGQGITYLDQGNAFFQGFMMPGSNKTSFWTWQVGSTYAYWNQVSATVPFTWVSGDAINGSFYYQAA